MKSNVNTLNRAADGLNSSEAVIVAAAYKTLGLHHGATRTEILSAYARRQSGCNPERQSGTAGALRDEKIEQYKALRHARSVLLGLSPDEEAEIIDLFPDREIDKTKATQSRNPHEGTEMIATLAVNQAFTKKRHTLRDTLPKIADHMRKHSLRVTLSVAFAAAALAVSAIPDTESASDHGATFKSSARTPATATQTIKQASQQLADRTGSRIIIADLVRLHRSNKTLELLQRGQKVNVLKQMGAEAMVSVQGPDGRQWRGTVAGIYLNAG